VFNTVLATFISHQAPGTAHIKPEVYRVHARVSGRALCVVVADRAEAVDVDDADEGLGPGRRCGGTDLCNQGG
jgi:hypothetical protein